MNAHRLAARAGTVLVPLMLWSCLSDGPTGPDNSRPEMHGDALPIAGRAPAVLGWSPSGQDIIYVAEQALRASRIADRQSRVLFQATGQDVPEHATIAYDGAEWFTGVRIPGQADGNGREVGGGYAIRAHSAAGTTVLTSTAGGPWVGVTHQQEILYFGSANSVVRKPRGGAATVLATGCVFILALSTDESQVLCETAYASNDLLLIRIADGAVTPLHLEAQFPVSGVRWDDQGFHLFDTHDGHSLRETIIPPGQTRGQTRTVAELAASAPDRVSMSNVAVSDDGRHAAYTSTVCGQRGSPSETQLCGGGGKPQDEVYLIDVASGTTTLAAVHNNSTGVSGFAFSPDGSRLAYAATGQIYVLNVPP